MTHAREPIRLSDVAPRPIEPVACDLPLPSWRGVLHAVVGAGESMKTSLLAATAHRAATAGVGVLAIDGEMNAPAWQRAILNYGPLGDNLANVAYWEMTESAADPATVAGICAQLGSGGYPPVQLIIWDSALSLLSRSVRSENDNVEVSRVYDRLREIVYITNAAGHIVDHVARGSGTLTSRGATAKFNELDVSYGVRLADGDVPNREQPFSVIVSVEKDRYGLLPGRRDREVLFVPTGDGGLHVEVTERDTATHRLSSSNPNTMLVAKIAALDPPPQSANDAAKRLGGNRQAALNAYRAWVSEGGSSGSVLKDGNHGTTTSSAGTGTGSNAGTTRNRRDEDAAPRCNVCEKPNLFHHESIERGTCARCAEVTAA